MTKVKDLTTGFGTLSYGAYTFSALRNVQFRYEPRYDQAQRAVIAIDCFLSVTGKIHGSDATSSTRVRQQTRMDSVVAALSRAGSTLIITDIGLGGTINTSRNGTTPDIDMGPHPTLIACTPWGADLCWNVVWECRFTIPPKCASSSISPGDVMSFEYDIEYATNPEGLLTRAINGELGIVQFRNGNKIAANPEAAFDKIRFNCPQYFKPVTFRRRFDRKRNKVEFMVVHEELSGDAFPQGIIEADLDYDLENRPPGFLQWAGSLSGTLKVAPGVPKKVAADKFFIIMFDIAAKLKATAGPKGVVIPERVKFGSKLFDRTSRFSVQWRMTACLHEILSKAGLWSAVPGTNYQQWRTSMEAAGVFSPRGGAGLRFNANDDVIVDLCAAPAKFSLGNDGGGRPQPYENTSLRLTCPDVTKENSYLDFRNSIMGTQSQNAIVHRIMQDWKLPGISPTGDGSSSPFPSAGSGSPGESAIDHVVQLEGKTDDYVLMTGRAMRLKWNPEIPALKTVAGVKVEEMGRSIKVEPLVSYFDCPLIGARWAILYRVKGQLYGVKAPRIKEFCMKDGEQDGR